MTTVVVVVAAAAAVPVATVAYCRGCLLDEDTIFWVGGDWQLLMSCSRYIGILLVGNGN